MEPERRVDECLVLEIAGGDFLPGREQMFWQQHSEGFLRGHLVLEIRKRLDLTPQVRWRSLRLLPLTDDELALIGSNEDR